MCGTPLVGCGRVRAGGAESTNARLEAHGRCRSCAYAVTPLSALVQPFHDECDVRCGPGRIDEGRAASGRRPRPRGERRIVGAAGDAELMERWHSVTPTREARCRGRW